MPRSIEESWDVIMLRGREVCKGEAEDTGKVWVERLKRGLRSFI